MKKSLVVAYSGILTALSAAMLFLGGISSVFTYIMPMFAGLVMIMLVKTFGIKSAFAVYVSTSILSFFLTADKECALMYILLFGYYPIIYNNLQKIKQFILRWFVKLLIFNISAFIVQLLLFYLFSIPFFEGKGFITFAVVFALMMNVMFIVYDYLVSKLFVLYTLKLEKKVKKYLKIK